MDDTPHPIEPDQSRESPETSLEGAVQRRLKRTDELRMRIGDATGDSRFLQRYRSRAELLSRQYMTSMRFSPLGTRRRGSRRGPAIAPDNPDEPSAPSQRERPARRPRGPAQPTQEPPARTQPTRPRRTEAPPATPRRETPRTPRTRPTTPSTERRLPRETPTTGEFPREFAPTIPAYREDPRLEAYAKILQQDLGNATVRETIRKARADAFYVGESVHFVQDNPPRMETGTVTAIEGGGQQRIIVIGDARVPVSQCWHPVELQNSRIVRAVLPDAPTAGAEAAHEAPQFIARRNEIVQRQLEGVLSREEYLRHFQYIARQRAGSCFILGVLNAMPPQHLEALIRSSVRVEQTGRERTWIVRLPLGSARGTGMEIRITADELNTQTVLSDSGAGLSHSSEGWRAIEFALAARSHPDFRPERRPSQQAVLNRLNAGGLSAQTLEHLIAGRQKTFFALPLSRLSGTEQTEFRTLLAMRSRSASPFICTVSTGVVRLTGASEHAVIHEGREYYRVSAEGRERRIPAWENHLLGVTAVTDRTITVIDPNYPNDPITMSRSIMESICFRAVFHQMDYRQMFSGAA